MSKTETHPANGSVASYVFGYLLSLELTAAAYFTVRYALRVHSSVNHPKALAYISILAIAQLIVQLVFFLHLKNDSKSRWNLNALLFAVLVVVIIVFGSLWIMNNLNYHMQSPQQMNKYLRSQGDL
jgi:cytochrome o ubiquinol oxidase operon protein cyoD